MVSFEIKEFKEFLKMLDSFKNKKQMSTQLNKIERIIKKKNNITTNEIFVILKLSKLKKPRNGWHLFVEHISKEFEQGMDGKQINAKASPLWQKLSDEEKKPFIEASKKESEMYKALKVELSESYQSNENEVDIRIEETNENENENDVDIRIEAVENNIQPKRIESNSKAKYDTDFWKDLDNLNWDRYESDNDFWEYSTNDNKYIIREGNSKKTKIHDKTMKSANAVKRSIAKIIEKKESAGYTMI